MYNIWSVCGASTAVLVTMLPMASRQQKRGESGQPATSRLSTEVMLSVSPPILVSMRRRERHRSPGYPSLTLPIVVLVRGGEGDHALLRGYGAHLPYGSG